MSAHSIACMQTFPSGPPVPVTRPPAWLWVAPLVSCGLLTAVSPIVVAAKLKDRQAWWGAGVIAAAWLVGFGLTGTGGEDSAVSQFGVVVYLGALLASIVYVLMLGPKAAWPTSVAYVAPPTQVRPDSNAAAVASVEAARRKREEARGLAQRDPEMARELRIGRPDLPRNFDDGGLVDLNSAPESVLIQTLGLSSPQAEEILATRERLERFLHPDDLMNLAELDPATYDRIRDRIVLL